MNSCIKHVPSISHNIATDSKDIDAVDYARGHACLDRDSILIAQ